ncbi:MAG: radical SAM protein, partial [Bacteroidota bacterium]|nr:radical SAM protein [Bacteroidota bacterium]
MKSKQTIINGLSGTVIGLYIRLDVMRMAWKWSQNLVGYLHVLQGLKRMVNQYLGENIRRRYVKVDGRYHWNLYIPGWKTLAYTKNIESEAFRFAPNGNKANRFTNVFLAITSRCPLRCEHCFEWDALNGSDTLSLADLKSIVNRIQQVGSGQIQFSGGEPMLRIDDLIEILHSARHDTEFWMLTSGYNLTLLNAQRLKQAGLDGVVVSLDHFNPEKHNQFRG